MTPRSATAIAHAVLSREITAADTVAEALEAAAADTTNAFVSLDESAHERAATIDAAVADGGHPGPLAGVPVAVKDLIDHAGRVTGAGSAFYRHQATSTAPCLARLEAAGAVVIGRTGLHEFAFGFSSENPWTGPIRNPWDPATSPGGSSGGSAAAVAAHIVPVGLGSDTGGSVRVPAALCGVVGLKVTHGRIPLTGVFPLVPSLDTVGAITRSLDDVATVTRLMSGDDGVDPWAENRPWGDPAPLGMQELEFVVPRGWIEAAPMSRDVEASYSTFLSGLEEAGATVSEVDLSELVPSGELAGSIGPEVAAIHRLWRQSGEPYGDDVGSRVDAALAVTIDEATAAQLWRRRLTKALGAATCNGSVVVTPAVAAMSKRIGVDSIHGHPYRQVLSWFSAPVNQTGHPALSVPVAGDGLQPSIQIIGQKWSEMTLVHVAGTLAAKGLVGREDYSSE